MPGASASIDYPLVLGRKLFTFVESVL